jgi:uncharacterized cofD-like protein
VAEAQKIGRVVVMGGGTGTFMLLSALRKYARNLTAIVTMSDDGGSSGVLRDELGVLPPGDIRQCLVALSDSPEDMRRLFTYRFEEGSLKGHSFGNLFLTAAEKASGGFDAGVKLAERVLNVKGQVLPVTTENVRLVATLADGSRVENEGRIQMHDFKRERPSLQLEPQATINPEAIAAIEHADVITVGPGDLYSSIIPVLLPNGMAEALRRTQAKKVFVANLVNKPLSTAGMQVHDYVNEITRHLGHQIFDYVIYNTAKPNPELAKRYLQDGEEPVTFSATKLTGQGYSAIGESLLAGGVALQAGDSLMKGSRSLIRHDGDLLARTLAQIYNQKEASR